VAALLDGDKLADAERLLMAEAILQPRAGWVHLDMGEIYFRRLWRRDAEREWSTALKLDPSLGRDPRLGDRLCTALGRPWKGAGERLWLRIGRDGVDSMNACIRNTDDLERLRTVVRLAERVGGRSAVDRALVAARTSELTRKR
jgi:hypothetical protein